MRTKQKVGVIASLLHEPPLLLLDEPLNGLNAKSSRVLKELIVMQTEKGGAVVFSTHIMEVAETMCSKIGIIDQGKVVAEGTMDELRKLSGKGASSLEDVFLKLTKQEQLVTDTVERLREAFA